MRAGFNFLGEKRFHDEVVQFARSQGWRVHARPPEMANQNPPLPTAVQESLLPPGLGDSLVGSDVCELTLAGEPTTKARPRFGGQRTYTDTKTAAAEDAIRWQLRAAGVRSDADHLLAVALRFRSSTGQRRDLDNLVKLVLDAANGFAWRDDVQVVHLDAAVDRRSSMPGTDLRVTRVGRYTSDCRRCGAVLGPAPGKTAGRDGYCSRACYDAAQRGGHMVACPECGAPVYRQRSEESKAKFCSRACSDEHKRGARSPRNDNGFPDLVLVRNQELIFAELKDERGLLSAAQAEWIAALENVAAAVQDATARLIGAHQPPPAVEMYVWRPADWDEINARLRRPAAMSAA